VGNIKYHNTKSSLKLAFLALSLLLVIILLGRAGQFLYNLTQPFNLAATDKKQYELNPDITQNIIFTSIKDPKNPVIYLVSFYPKEDKIIALTISDQIYAPLPKDLGQWRMGSVYQLGQESPEKNGIALLKLSISKLTGLPIDGIFISNEVGDKSIYDLLLSLRKNPIAQLQFISNLKTDLTLLETIKLLSSISSVRSNKITVLNLEKSTITESKLLPDSTRVLGVNVIKLDTFIRENMPDDNIVDEGKTVAIYNATSYPGLAAEAGRFVTNLGGNVVITQTLDTTQPKSQVVFHEGEDGGLTGLRMSQFFAPQCIKNPCQSDNPKIQNSRAQITIVLGEDFYNYWHKE
jgi:hypothetical protein